MGTFTFSLSISSCQHAYVTPTHHPLMVPLGTGVGYTVNDLKNIHISKKINNFNVILSLILHN